MKKWRRKPLQIKDLGIAGRAGPNVSPLFPTTYVTCREKPARWEERMNKRPPDRPPQQHYI